ncbi:hypothetical protein NKR23_g8116 [Pleurostoma richardsiae]|uniref:CFEM domain-containing protein n=1 Tax=Pleurostoma richardsiae TaxID=41990 RepID=A0AA38R734_9PEZI|nr:hypothetical protein NKR23_g8116 [Pleurostoma richardsiae]
MKPSILAMLAIPVATVCASDVLDSVPECAQNCAIEALPLTSCSFTDMACLCRDTKLMAAVKECSKEACTVEEQGEALRFADKQCAKYLDGAATGAAIGSAAAPSATASTSDEDEDADTDDASLGEGSDSDLDDSESAPSGEVSEEGASHGWDWKADHEDPTEEEEVEVVELDDTAESTSATTTTTTAVIETTATEVVATGSSTTSVTAGAAGELSVVGSRVIMAVAVALAMVV